MIAQETLQNLETQRDKLISDKKILKSQKDKDKIDREIHKLNATIEPLKPYLQIEPGDYVRNGSKEKIGTVRSKEIQNTLPIVWIDWGDTLESHTPQSITVIDPKELIWRWIEGDFTRTYDSKSCDDIETLIKEIAKVRANPEDTDKKHRIIEIWDNTIMSKYPKNVDFILDGDRVKINGYATNEEYKLLFPIANNKIVHPLKLKKFTFKHFVSAKQETKESDSQQEKPAIILDPEFKALLPAPTPDRKEKLEKMILTEGCRDALIVWKGNNTLVDGYTRYEICTRNNIEFKTTELEFDDRDDVICWMIENQDSRRNLDPDYASYLRGILYRKTKKKRGGDRNSEGLNQHLRSKVQNEPLSLNKESTAKKVAEKVNVSESTIKRDADFSNDVEVLADRVGLKPRDILMSKCSRSQIKKMKDLPSTVIQKKLEDPKYIDKTEIPEFSVGDAVKIKGSMQNPDLVGHSRSVAIIDRVYGNSSDIRIWQKLIPNVPLHCLEPIKGDTVTLNVSVSPAQLIALMEKFNCAEDAIASSLNLK